MFRLSYKEYWFLAIYTVSIWTLLCYWFFWAPCVGLSKTGSSHSFKTWVRAKIPPWNRSRYFRPSIPQLFLELDQFELFLSRPFLTFDGDVEMVVVSLSTLFAASILYFKLYVEYPGYLGPLFDASFLVDFLESFVLLSGRWITAAVQAFLSLIVMN